MTVYLTPAVKGHSQILCLRLRESPPALRGTLRRFASRQPYPKDERLRFEVQSPADRLWRAASQAVGVGLNSGLSGEEWWPQRVLAANGGWGMACSTLLHIKTTELSNTASPEAQHPRQRLTKSENPHQKSCIKTAFRFFPNTGVGLNSKAA